jgi:hypothetical protein
MSIDNRAGRRAFPRMRIELRALGRRQTVMRLTALVLALFVGLTGCTDDAPDVVEPRSSSATATTAGIATQSSGTAASCPGSVPRRGVDDAAEVSADALPYIDNAVTDREVALAVMSDAEAELTARLPGVMDVVIGPGFGRAWVGENGGVYAVVPIDDYAFTVVLNSLSDCPIGTDLHRSEGGIPLFFVAAP